MLYHLNQTEPGTYRLNVSSTSSPLEHSYNVTIKSAQLYWDGGIDTYGMYNIKSENKNYTRLARKVRKIADKQNSVVVVERTAMHH